MPRSVRALFSIMYRFESTMASDRSSVSVCAHVLKQRGNKGMYVNCCGRAFDQSTACLPACLHTTVDAHTLLPRHRRQRLLPNGDRLMGDPQVRVVLLLRPEPVPLNLVTKGGVYQAGSVGGRRPSPSSINKAGMEQIGGVAPAAIVAGPAAPVSGPTGCWLAPPSCVHVRWLIMVVVGGRSA